MQQKLITKHWSEGLGHRCLRKPNPLMFTKDGFRVINEKVNPEERGQGKKVLTETIYDKEYLIKKFTNEWINGLQIDNIEVLLNFVKECWEKNFLNNELSEK
jgi:hypothetical protein